MINRVKLSVVLPCYNVEKYIRKGLDSILAQTLQEWEAILVDDGATDSTARICDEYAKKDNRFHVIHTENQGVSCARNTGMKEANGELLYFMDPDDWIEPSCFERCYEIYKKYDCDIVHIGSLWHEETHSYESKREFEIYEGRNIIDKYTGPLSGFGQEALNHYFQGNSIWAFHFLYGACFFVYRRSFIIDNKINYVPKLKRCEDKLFLIEATYKANRIVSIPDILYQYYLRNNGAASQERTQLRLFEDHFVLMVHRSCMRQMIREIDLMDYYLGSNILSCLRLVITLSKKWKWYGQFQSFVTHSDVQEAIHRVSLKNAPLRFAIPVRLLKVHCQWFLFFGCWMAHKLGVRLPDTL